MQNTDVVVIGAGLSGLLACKYMKSVGLSCLVFEATDDIGGVWKYREKPNGRGGVTISTVSTSSKSVNEFSDFPMPEEYPPFQKHSQVMEYLNNYADHFDLRDSIHLNHEIVRVEKVGEEWETEDHNGKIYRSKFMIICAGMHQYPNKAYEKDERFAEATVKMIHSSDYRRLTDEYFDKDILIIGGGETASDLAVELTHAAKSVTMCIPNGQWLFPAVTPVQVHTNSARKATMVSDTFSSRLRRLVDPPFATYESKLDTKAHFTSRTFVKWGGKNGHGIPEWENEAPYYGQFFNKNANVVQLAHRGLIEPKRTVKTVQGNIAEFDDGTKKEIDIIVFCSGYHTRFPYFRDEQYSRRISEHFMFFLHNDDSSIAYIGFARPLIGSFMGLSEMQSLYVSKVFSGALTPPEKSERDRIIEQEKVFHSLVYSGTTNRIDGLVNFQSYMDDLATLAGVRPNYRKLFFKNPVKWYYAISAAHNNCQFLLHDEAWHDEIFRRYRQYHPDNLKVSAHIYALIVNLFPRMFDGSDTIFTRTTRFASNVLDFLLFVLFSPVLLFRILFPIEERWKKKKRRMIENRRAAELVHRVGMERADAAK